MITNDERRVAAERLRAVEWAHEDELARKIEEAVGCGIGQDWEDMDVVDRLSELIEPAPDRTCRMRNASWDDGRITWGCICSACGKKFEHESGKYWSFCPNCGTRVAGE